MIIAKYSGYHARMKTRYLLLICFVLSICPPASAQRDPVLKQIDLPHSYYFREMYLPQLTSGPSSVTWSPDSQSVIYSMSGSLWMQSLNSTTAEQLTTGPGYDYQPDWSPDGKWIVFSRYNKDAVELMLLELTTKQTRPLTNGGHVNVDARWSPDGKKIAFVSTQGTGHFHVFLADMSAGAEPVVKQLTKERKSVVSRYYYSAIDHEISPTWSPDSSEIIFVSNNENIYGTGGFWRMKADPEAAPRRIHYEETTWKAHPDWSRDGKRLIYSSYLGRQWHQLWITTVEGGDPFPLTYGDYDITSPRWSPDNKKIAFISNKHGNTSLGIQDATGGAQRELKIEERRTLQPPATISLTVLGADGNPSPARVSITGEDHRTYAPVNAWIHADDAFVRGERPFEPHYFHTTGKSEIDVPAGKILVEVMKGPEHRFEQQTVEIKAGEKRDLAIRLQLMSLPEDHQNWISGDLHVHMNYAGTYRNTPENMMMQAAAENLPVVYNLVVNKEQRIPDIEYYSPRPDPASNERRMLVHSQEFHTSYWGHMGLLNLKLNFLIPDYASYSNTGAASPFPTNAVAADLAHAQGAVVGYVHPYDTVPDPADRNTKLTHELPADVALGKVDYLEVVGFSDHRATAEVWYRLLNCGFRLAAGAGTDAMSNYASLRGPVGTDRVYVKSESPLAPDTWNEALRKGHSFVTNGPLVWLKVEGKGPGEDLNFSKKQKVKFTVSMQSIVPVDHLELVYNGKVVQTLSLTGDRRNGTFSGSIPVNESGWFVLRAWNEKATYPILDIYPYATTNPVFVTIAGKPVRSKETAAYFIAWVDRLIEATQQNTDYNTEAEKKEVMNSLHEARKIFETR